MCGGYTLAKIIEKIEERFEAELEGDFLPNFNARPSQLLPIITSENPQQIVLAHWGLKPAWLERQGINKVLINTRNDSVLKPGFKKDLQERRCLVLADGFLEWEKSGKFKLPHRFGIGNFDLFAMAGIYERDESGMLRFSILTTEPNDYVARIHNRMPVMLQPGKDFEWLKPLPSTEKYLDFLQPYPDENFIDEIVSRKINSVDNNSEDLLESDQDILQI